MKLLQRRNLNGQWAMCLITFKLLPVPFLDENKHFHYGFWKIQSTLLQGKSFLLGAFSAYFTKDSNRVGKPFDSSYRDLVDVICSAGLSVQTGPSAAGTQAVISIRFQKDTHCLFLEVQQGVLQSKLLPCHPTSILLSIGLGTFS